MVTNDQKSVTPLLGLHTFLPQRPSGEHRALHDQSMEWMRAMIAMHRNRIGLDPRWTFRCGILCPREMPLQEGVISWDSQVLYAEIKLRCDLSGELAEHVLIHELFELAAWETGDVFVSTLRYIKNEELKDYMLSQYQAARNREIELQVTRYLGHPRPGHLMEGQRVTELSPASAHYAAGVISHEPE